MKIAVTVDIGEADAREFAEMIAEALRRRKEEERQFRIPDTSEVRAWMEEAAKESRCTGYDADHASRIFCSHYGARNWQCQGRLITDPRAKAREWAFRDIAELTERRKRITGQEGESTFELEDFIRLAEQRTFGG